MTTVYLSTRPCRLLAFVAAVSLLFSSCKKKEGGSLNEGPDCTAAQSRLIRETASRADTVIESLNYSTIGLPDGFTALGGDTVLEVVDNGKIRNYYLFNDVGDQFVTRRVMYGSTDTTYVDFYYEFSGDHRLIKRWTRVKDRTGSRLYDSVAVKWENGNMIAETELATGNTVVTFEYNLNTPGRNIRNQPVQVSRWLYRQGSVVVTSKDYIRRSKEEAIFDTKGRLKILASDISGPTVRTDFEYDCK